jgi:hypothetical protein
MVGEIEMSDLATTSSAKQQSAADDSPAPSQTASAMAPTTLITEGQVRLSTAAAVALPPARTRGFGDVMHAVAAKVREAFAGSNKPPAQRHYPSRYTFLENSLMSREMDRL